MDWNTGVSRAPLRQQIPGTLIALLIVVSVVVCGCSSLRIHRPQDLSNAQQAQTQFQAAELTKTVVAERDSMHNVLTEELELVREHTLARRDARLLYIIGEGDTYEAWAFLKDDINSRLKELGVEDFASLKDLMRRQAQAEKQKDILDGSADFYEAERKKEPTLPPLNCPQLPKTAPPPANSIAKLLWDDYAQGCLKYLKIKRGRADGAGMSLDAPLANGEVIEAMKAAKEGAKMATSAASKTLATAKKDYAKSLKNSNVGAQDAARESMRAAAGNLIKRANKVNDALNKLIQGQDTGAALTALGLGDLVSQYQKAKSGLDDQGLGLVISDLISVPALAKLKASRGQLMVGLSSTLQGETATNVVASLKAIGVAFDDPEDAPLTAMVLKEKQLELDIVEARKREAFYDNTLALLKEQEAAYRDELAFLGQSELIRKELEATGCLSTVTNQQSDYLEHLFTDKDASVVKCRERVFRLLVQYSAAWTMGRAKSEQIDYRLIALHHESALDTSEIAFQKWESLLGLPIDQLVAHYKTGLKPEDILSIIQALGIGAIAVGVN